MKYHLGYQIKEDEMGKACDMHGREECLWGNLKERDHLNDLGTDGRTILNCFLKKEDEIVYTRFYGSGQRHKRKETNLQVP
jgi:hypothetical protein